MKLERWEIESIEMDMKAIRRDGIDKYRGNASVIRHLERLLVELKKGAER